jgi:hypothetical protein
MDAHFALTACTFPHPHHSEWTDQHPTASLALMAQVEASLAAVPWPYPRLFLQPLPASSSSSSSSSPWSLRLVAWGLGPEDVVAAARERPLPAAPPTSSWAPSATAGPPLPPPPPLRPLSSTGGGGGGASSFLSSTPTSGASHYPNHHAPALASTSSSSLRHGGVGPPSLAGLLHMGAGADEEEEALLVMTQGRPACFAVAGIIKGLPREALAVAHLRLTATVLRQRGEDDDDDEDEEEVVGRVRSGRRATRWGRNTISGSSSGGGGGGGGGVAGGERRRRRRSSGAAASAAVAAGAGGSSSSSFLYREVLAVPLCPEDGTSPAATFKLPANSLPRPGEYTLLLEAALVDGGGRSWVVPQGDEGEGRLVATLACVPRSS